jgi:hypothetical protein
MKMRTIASLLRYARADCRRKSSRFAHSDRLTNSRYQSSCCSTRVPACSCDAMLEVKMAFEKSDKTLQVQTGRKSILLQQFLCQVRMEFLGQEVR